GLHRDWDLSGDFARATLVDTEAEAESVKLKASADLTRAGIEVLARGTVAGDVTMVCSRCAGPAHVVLDAPFEGLFLPRDADAPPPDEENPQDELDVAIYDNDEIDLEDTLREELLVALPYAPLCSETCKGLCPTCGKDLNEGPCACPEPAARDERLGALRHIKID